MLTNYFKTAWRNMLRNKAFSFISIFGLAVGIASFVLIALYVVNELSYDRFHPNYQNIYRVNTTSTTSGISTDLATSHAPLARTLAAEYPEVLGATRLASIGSLRVGLQKENEPYSEDRLLFADSNFLQVFSFPLLKGNPNTALLHPHSLVLTESTARKYFGRADPIGKPLAVEDDSVAYIVTGVAADVPANSHLHFDMLASMSTDKAWNTEKWIDEYPYTYVVLKPGADAKALEKKMQSVIYRYMAPEIEYHSGLKMADWEKAGSRTGYYLIPLKDIHLRSTSTEELEPRGDISYIYVYAIIACIILAIAVFNFVNMATARSASRAKEVGVRKVIGSTKSRLIYQFTVESILISLLATVVAGVLVALLTPSFEGLVGKALNFAIIPSLTGILLLLALAAVVGVLAGLYPAFVLSAFQPATVLKGAFSKGGRSGWLRSSLVVAQFTASIVIIIGTIAVYKQLRFMLTKNLGFDKDQVLVIRRPDVLKENLEAFKNDLLRNPAIAFIARSSSLPGKRYTRRSYRRKGDAESFVFPFNQVSDNYREAMGLKTISGRFFSKEQGLDDKAVVINESAAKAFGFADPIGKELTSPWHRGELLTIIGVVNDFNLESLHKKAGPAAMELLPDDEATKGYLTVKLKGGGNIRSTVQAIEEKWKNYSDGKLFDAFFYDEDYGKLYQSEFVTGRVLVVFAALSILIACLGLVGLLMFTVSVRRKEIGIRKVFGASVSGIVQLVSKDFLRLVLFAMIIAFPLAWWALHKWLEDFAYRTSIGWWMFAAAGLFALAVAFFTISFQAVKAALANPVKSLRTE